MSYPTAAAPFSSITKLRPFALVLCSSLVLTLLGCQPKEHIETATETDLHEHSEQSHGEHDHVEDGHAEDEHDNPEHKEDHDEEAHSEHDKHEHDEHDEHDHEEEVHGEHDDHEEAHGEHDDDHHDDHAGHDHGVNRTAFDCAPDKTISVFYHTDATPQTAHLLIDGIEYDLTQTPAAGADTQRFASNMGLDDTQGILWQVDGSKAVLFGFPVADIDAVAGTPAAVDTKNSQTLYTCQQKS